LPPSKIAWRGLLRASLISARGLLSIRTSRGGRPARDQEPRRSPFHGVPVGIKDIFDTFDMPTAYGSPIYKGHRPATDTAIVGLLRRAGLVILGKCATTEFASPVPIGVKNPHDFGRSPGVSSSGSAAAVADYMVPLSVGSQTGGSTILPAAFCGVFGFKASLTGIDRGGIRHLRPGLDTIGLFARDLSDLATLQAIVTGGVPPRLRPNSTACVSECAGRSIGTRRFRKLSMPWNGQPTT
jgi:Asp-tRNA(Asn)/Glu-tRNA(Gln) amidotransferase A subunit family amidase